METRILNDEERNQMIISIEHLEKAILQNYGTGISTLLNKIPIFLNVRWQYKGTDDLEWTENVMEEPDIIRITITAQRKWSYANPLNFNAYGVCIDGLVWYHRFWSCITTLMMVWGQDIVPRAIINCPMHEWTDDTITYFIEGQMGYGS
jgi:hypothetical protein